MKILSLNFERSWRGGERQTLLNAIGLINKGYDVHLLCRKDSYIEKIATEHNVTTVTLNSIIGVLYFLLRNARRYDVLHAQDSQILTYCVLSKPFHAAKIIFTRRVNFHPKGITTRLKYRLCDRIIAISNSVKNIVADFSSRNDITIISDIVVRTPSDKNKIQEQLTKINPQQKKIIGTIAALTSEKNPLANIEVVRLLKDRREDFIFLHFGDGKMKKEMIQLISENNLQDYYFLMGFVENVYDYLSVMDVFIMTSSNEGLCSSVLDAFLHRVPVVSTAAGGLRELIKEGRGLACQIENPVMIADGIDHILNNTRLVVAQIEKAYTYVIEKHSMEHISDQYDQLIKTLFIKQRYDA
jgi:glycosyltransferase involved in cell wall biosynthesis